MITPDEASRLFAAFSGLVDDYHITVGPDGSADIGSQSADETIFFASVSEAIQFATFVKGHQHRLFQTAVMGEPLSKRQGWAGPGWYFWDETDAHAIGPYQQIGDAIYAMWKYQP